MKNEKPKIILHPRSMKRAMRFITVVCLLFSALQVSADSRKEYVRRYKDIAIREMERTGIPASIKLAQGILESGCGQSELAVNANNHFGIKCHEWDGDTYSMDDDKRNECFRKYKNAEQSWIDHSEFLRSRPRYAGLFSLKTTDYRAWARGLKAAGYATSPTYADRLIGIIEEEGLQQYDRIIQHPTGEAAPVVPVKQAVNKKPEMIQQPAADSYRNREEMRNGILCIPTVEGDSFEKIARYYGIKLKRLLEYNDKDRAELEPGQLVYLKKKKTKAARGYEFHRVKAGDSLYDIAQQYGVRLKNLCRYNYLDPDSALTEGEKIFLRKKADLY